MRVRDHIALSTAGAALLYPLVGRRVLAAWAASILIDADHYVWFCIRAHRLSPLQAFQFFNQADPPQHPATRFLHSPTVISLALLLGVGTRKMMPAAIGMAMHAAMDSYHAARLDQSRAAALRRDNFTCQSCGEHSLEVVAHLDRQPPLMPSYRTENLVVLCPRCHEEAHARQAAFFTRPLVTLPALLAGIWRGGQE